MTRVKAIFFDWFNTVARYEPPRELMYHKAFQEEGYEIPQKTIIKAIVTADQLYFAENSKKPIRHRAPQEQIEVLSCYPKGIVNLAGITTPPEIHAKIISKLIKEFKKITMVLFDDVLPVLKTLKEKGFILGLITNASRRDVQVIGDKLGLSQRLNFIVTSEEAGAEKPHPQIFNLALKLAAVPAEEAAHVGDQYQADVMGARGVGINPVLIDRYGISTDVTDCPSITTLYELEQYLS